MRFPTPMLRPLAVAASLAMLSLAAGAAVAQTQAPPPAASTEPAAHPHTHMKLADRFAQANTTNDGHLTLAQAKAGMPSVARHFAAIDKDSKGYVTLDDIHEYLKEQRAAKRESAGKTNG
jgi:hypothetical protein